VTPGFVELGERQEALNRELGQQIAGACDVAIIVNMTNRAALTAGLADRAFPKEQTIEVASLNEALAYMATMLRTGDVVLYENDLPDSFK
jgi:UDP-N-acetylmuramoyl-tripeptide--D-alanyl-D-alanine ligase